MGRLTKRAAAVLAVLVAALVVVAVVWLHAGDSGDTDRNGAPPESRASVSTQVSEARQRTDANTGPAWLHIVLGLVGAAAVGAVGMWLLLRRRPA